MPNDDMQAVLTDLERLRAEAAALNQPLLAYLIDMAAVEAKNALAGNPGRGLGGSDPGS